MKLFICEVLTTIGDASPRHNIRSYIGIVFLCILVFCFSLKEVDAAQQRIKQRATFNDCNGASWCPEMITVVASTLLIGARNSQLTRSSSGSPRYSPPRRIKVNKFAVSTAEITLEQFHKFVVETKRQVEENCLSIGKQPYNSKKGYSYMHPGFQQQNNHPVVCVNWHDAQDYVQWLSKKTKKEYRLLTEAEWEYIARSDSKETLQSSENIKLEACQLGNIADKESVFSWRFDGCSDGYAKSTSPVGSFKANKIGVFGIHGNVSEWVSDRYIGGDSDRHGVGGDEASRTIRGGSWASPIFEVYNGIAADPQIRISSIGFRVARSMEAK